MMKAIIVGIMFFLGFFLFGGSKFAYNEPKLQREFCASTDLCKYGFFQQD